MAGPTMPPPLGRRATLEDLLAIPEEHRHHEIIDGELVEKASPSGEHARAQRKLGVFIDPFDQDSGGSVPGGWWLMTEADVVFGPNELYRPDVLGWRRDRVPVCPSGYPLTERPDWIAEIVSTSNAGTDRVRKLSRYHHHRVPHYWVLDPVERNLTVFRWSEPGYLAVLTAFAGDRVRAEPFEAIELDLGNLLGR